MFIQVSTIMGMADLNSRIHSVLSTTYSIVLDVTDSRWPTNTIPLSVSILNPLRNMTTRRLIPGY